MVAGLLLLNAFSGDPTIYLIYARNVAAADPFSFNPGEFSSGSTSPLWAGILAIAFVFPGWLLGVKVIGMGCLVGAIVVTYRMAVEVGSSRVGAALATTLVVSVGGIPSFLLYESPLIILLVSSLLLINFARFPLDGRLPGGLLPKLALIWAALPLVRPDALLVVLLNLAFLLVLVHERGLRLRTVVAFGLSLIPSALYYGYSLLTLGTASTSALCRSAGLREGAPELLGVPYSTTLIQLFLSAPFVLFLAAAIWGWERCRRRGRREAAWTLLGTAIVGAYVVILTAMAPTTSEASRYFLPALPVIVVFAAAGLGSLWTAARKRGYRLVLSATVVLFLLLPLGLVARAVLDLRSRSLDFDTIVEREVVEYVNGIAPKNATVLAYDVQTRFYLRSDLSLLSLDGITDGKVGPYLESGDLTEFLEKHRPMFWLANDAVHYRPFLQRSILRRVVDQIGAEQGASTTIDGITFTNLRVRTKPTIPGFADYRQVYALGY